MKVRLVTLMAGPDGVVQAGSVLDLPADHGRALVEGGHAKMVEEARVEAPERAVGVRADEHAVAVERAQLVDLVGAGPGQALLEAGYSSIEDARKAIGEEVDLTEVEGVGPATVGKLSAVNGLASP